MLSFFFFFFFGMVLVCSNYIDLHVTVQIFGEGNGTPLQYFCLENPMDEGAW